MSSIIINNDVVTTFTSRKGWRLQGRRGGVYDTAKPEDWNEVREEDREGG